LPTRRRAAPLTVDDPVRIASISKLVVRSGVMRLVEEGRIDLDRDVSDYLGWRSATPPFPTTRSRSASSSPTAPACATRSNYVIPLGGTVQAALADPKAFDPSTAGHLLPLLQPRFPARRHGA
jgi:hypothetical protein